MSELLSPALEKILQDSEVTHEACCIEDDEEAITMCGLEGVPYEEDGPMTDCVVCLDLVDQWAYYADKYGEDPTEPDDPRCRVCPRNRK